MYIFISVLIFGLLITVHEIGHFLAAKFSNVKVTELAIGMGPAIIKRTRGETQYSLRILPIGGYCAMEEDEKSSDPRSITNQSFLRRFIILFAGSAMNFITGFVILLFIVPNSMAFTTPTILDFVDGSPFQGEDALMVGDTFHRIDGQRVFFTSNIPMLLARTDSEYYNITVIRDGERVELRNFRFAPFEHEVNGQMVTRLGIGVGVKEEGLIPGIRDTWNCSLDLVRMVWMGLSDLVTGRLGLNDVAGVVGIVGIISDAGATAPTFVDAVFNIAYLTAFISINLAIMNMLPIPALDGGRILFLFITSAIEKIIGRRLNPKYEGYIHATGLVLLLGLLGVIMVNDIFRLVVN